MKTVLIAVQIPRLVYRSDSRMSDSGTDSDYKIESDGGDFN